MKKLLLFIIVVLVTIPILITFSLSGCKVATEETTEAVEETTEETSEAVEETTEETSETVEETGILPVTDEDITINFWTLAGPIATEFNAFVALYQEKHPNVTFNITQQEVDALKDFAPSALATGKEEIDLLWYWADTDGFEMARNGLLLNIDPYMEAYGLWDEILPEIRDTLKIEGLEGYYFFPENGVTYPYIFYNKDIFKEVGIEPPVTMDDLYDISKKLNDAGYEALETMSKTIGLHIHMLVTTRARYLSVDEFEQLRNWRDNPEIFKNEHILQAFEEIVKMNEEGVFPEAHIARDDGAARLEFTQGRAGMYHSGSWGVAMLRDEAPDMDLGYFSLPNVSGTERILSFWGNAVAIPATTTSEDKLGVIFDFFKEITTKEYALTTILEIGLLPTSANITQEEVAAVADPLLGEMIAEYQKKGTVAQYGAAWEPKLTDAEMLVMGELTAGTMTPEEAVEYLYNTALEILAEE